ncbi:MAG: cell division protein FtsZ [Chloroflexi bacterium]|nr:cell division protein FtsZ [Chloroflexota bacterium]
MHAGPGQRAAASPLIKVVGVGGAGCNAVTRMVRQDIRGVEFIAMNTDARSLALTEASTRIQLGKDLCAGLGAGGDPGRGAKAAEQSREEIRGALLGADLVFITAGIGGGTGTGAAPVVAGIARECRALCVAVVTRPFSFEGRRRHKVADESLARLAARADALVVIPNDRLVQVADGMATAGDGFKLADDYLCQSITAICDLVTIPSVINVDLAAVRSVLADAGPAWLSVGTGAGPDRAAQAARNAISSRLLGTAILSTDRALFTISAGADLTMLEMAEAAKIVSEALGPEARTVFGLVLDSESKGQVKVTLIAAGVSVGPRTNVGGGRATAGEA